MIRKIDDRLILHSMIGDLSIRNEWKRGNFSPEEMDSTQLWLVHTPSFDQSRTIGVLTEPEEKKSAAFRFSKDKITYRTCRTVLRLLVSEYLDHMPKDVVFTFNDFGKPELADLSRKKLFFNVSHSGDFGLIALHRKSPIGVDIEFAREIEYENLIESIFSSAERTELLSIPPELRHKAFYCGWTRKEAFIKAIGKGLSFSLQDFFISLDPRKKIADVEMNSTKSEFFNQWKVLDVSVVDQYCAAIAVEKNDFRRIDKYIFEL